MIQGYANTYELLGYISAWGCAGLTTGLRDFGEGEHQIDLFDTRRRASTTLDPALRHRRYVALLELRFQSVISRL